MTDQKNIIVAIVLSLAVLLGWQMLIEQPKREKQIAEQQRQEQLAAERPDNIPAAPSAGEAGEAAPATGAPRSRDDVIGETDRLAIATPDLSGSINLAGGRIDDLILTNYRTTTEEDAAPITLLSPSGSPAPYFAEFGWLTGDGKVTGGGSTAWSSEGGELTPENP